MDSARPTPSDIAFTPSVKAIQVRKGSRSAYARMEQGRGWQTAVTPELQAWLAPLDSFYLATANAQGQPYIQHRGGPAGFLQVLDAHTLAFADFSGNRQYISAGNLAENPQAFLFTMDYARRRRIKLWGQARVVEDDPDLLGRLADPDYDAVPEQAVVFTLQAWDVNCPQHIPQKFNASDVERALRARDERIAALEQELARYRAAPP
jgi:predicted pyridoxine 5'-phosphate oxidase superfamily flavin-nucleotide-binding protein